MKLFKKYKKLDYYINLFKPSKSVYIAFDGVAPAAKLKQQERRIKSYYIKQLTKTIDGIVQLLLLKHNLWMHYLKTYQYFKNKYSTIKIVISTSLEKGEGEHKLCQYMRDKKCLLKMLYYKDYIDLIMLGLLHNHYCKSIYLYRETPEFIKQLNRQLDPSKQYFLNIHIFKKKY